MAIKFLAPAVIVISSLTVGTSVARSQDNTSNRSFQEPIFQNGASGNIVTPNSNQNVQNGQSNSQSINYPAIPLSPVIQNPVNTENDFGLNLGAALNTIDGRNTTIYLGITYQPGRTDDHNARMAKLKSETQLLESQKQITQSQLDLLKQQVAEQEIRLQRIRSTTPNPTK